MTDGQDILRLLVIRDFGTCSCVESCREQDSNDRYREQRRVELRDTCGMHRNTRATIQPNESEVVGGLGRENGEHENDAQHWCGRSTAHSEEKSNTHSFRIPVPRTLYRPQRNTSQGPALQNSTDCKVKVGSAYNGQWAANVVR